MSRFLTAADNVACPRQNVRCDLKRWRQKAKPLSWCWRVTVYLFLVSADRKMFLLYSKVILYFTCITKKDDGFLNKLKAIIISGPRRFISS